MSLRLKLLTSFSLILAVWLFSGYYILSRVNQLGHLQSSLPEIDLNKNALIRSYAETLQSLRTAMILHTTIKPAKESAKNQSWILSRQLSATAHLDSLRELSREGMRLSESFRMNGFDRLLLETARQADLIDTVMNDSVNFTSGHDRLDLIVQLHDSLVKANVRFIEQYRKGHTINAPDKLVRTIIPLFDRINQHLDAYAARSSYETNYKLSMIHRMTVQIKILMYLFWSVTLIFILVFIYYYFQKIIHAIQRLKEASTRIARGEFDARIDNRSFPEMDDLADSFNTMAEQLQELEKLKSDFFNKLVHDFKSPLDNIKQSADVLLSEIAGGTLSPKQKEFLEIIKRSSLNLRQFVQDQLDESKLISGQMELKFESTDIKELVTERLQLQKPVATLRRIHFNLKYTPTPLIIDCDRSKISRVIDNLLNNAIKFSYESTAVDIELDETDTLIECRIKDHGPGIPHTQKERIFQKYVRLPSPVKAPGTGLGLYTAKYIVQLHHGTIWVESKPGSGSTFAFSLPKSIRVTKPT